MIKLVTYMKQFCTKECIFSKDMAKKTIFPDEVQPNSFGCNLFVEMVFSYQNCSDLLGEKFV